MRLRFSASFRANFSSSCPGLTKCIGRSSPEEVRGSSASPGIGGISESTISGISNVGGCSPSLSARYLSVLAYLFTSVSFRWRTCSQAALLSTKRACRLSSCLWRFSRLRSCSHDSSVRESRNDLYLRQDLRLSLIFAVSVESALIVCRSRLMRCSASCFFFVSASAYFSA